MLIVTVVLYNYLIDQLCFSDLFSRP